MGKNFIRNNIASFSQFLAEQEAKKKKKPSKKGGGEG